MQRARANTLHQEALDHLVGGVNSPVRAFKSVHGNPIYFEKASGAIVTDVDGNELVDFVQSWGPLVHGHSHPKSSIWFIKRCKMEHLLVLLTLVKSS